MRVLGGSVLAFEAIVVILLIPVAITVGTVSGPPWLFISVGLALVIALIVTAGFVTRPWAITVGWILQVLIVATAVLVPVMVIVGGIFMLLWALAIRWSRRVDQMKRDSSGEE
jgi:hypothetical protein